MARTINRLTARAAETVGKPGRHADGGGLYLSVDRSGRRRWVFMSWRAGKQVEIGLGSAKSGGADFVSLAAARRAAEAIRQRVESGEDLRAARDAPVGTPTFEQAVTAYIANHGSGWRNDKHRAQWKTTMATYAQAIAKTEVDAINEDDVLSILKPIWTDKPETAARVRGRIESVLDFARARKWRTGENPARWRGNLKHILPPRRNLTRGHHAAAAYADVPALYGRMASLPGVSPKALRFTILTAARSGESRGAIRAEIDMARALWTIPANRMKAGKEHRVPLSDAAMEIVRSVLPEGGPPDDLLFTGPRTGRPLSDMTLSAVLRRMGVGMTVHGFRSSFRDWAGDQMGFDRETAETALAHTIRDATERAYRRGDALEKRRALMNQWADHCTAFAHG